MHESNETIKGEEVEKTAEEKLLDITPGYNYPWKGLDIRAENVLLGYLWSGYTYTKTNGAYVQGGLMNVGTINFAKEPGDGSGNGLEGNRGKPGSLGDERVEPVLAGSGGSNLGGGDGLRIGAFGLGGAAAVTASSGGGGGFFGGGSGYGYGGGGGGSCYVLGDEMDSLTASRYFEDVDPLIRGRVMGSGRDIEYKDNERMYNGLVKINGMEYEYTGDVQEYFVGKTGSYTIECYGAQGGGFSSSNNILDQGVGGMGGYAKGTFNLMAGLTLYIYVGQAGSEIRAPQRPFGGGGGGEVRGYAGGGASDVRINKGDMYSRLIVGGGGGGVYKPPTSLDDIKDRVWKEIEGEQGNIEDLKDGERKIKLKGNKYLINDSSLATVTIDYTTTYDLQPEKIIKVRLYVDGVYRGDMYRRSEEVIEMWGMKKTGAREEIVIEMGRLKAGGAKDDWVYDKFDDWIPKNTPPYWADITVEIVTNLDYLYIERGGVNTVITTKKRPGDVELGSNYDEYIEYMDMYNRLGVLLDIKEQEDAVTDWVVGLDMGSSISTKTRQREAERVERLEEIENNEVLGVDLRAVEALRIQEVGEIVKNGRIDHIKGESAAVRPIEYIESITSAGIGLLGRYYIEIEKEMMQGDIHLIVEGNKTYKVYTITDEVGSVRDVMVIEIDKKDNIEEIGKSIGSKQKSEIHEITEDKQGYYIKDLWYEPGISEKIREYRTKRPGGMGVSVSGGLSIDSIESKVKKRIETMTKGNEVGIIIEIKEMGKNGWFK